MHSHSTYTPCKPYIKYLSPVFLYYKPLLNISKTVFLISYIVWVSAITAFECCPLTPLCKISSLYSICSQADLLSHGKHCITGTNVSLPSGESQAWTRMNTGINLPPLHSCFIPICPLHPLLSVSPFHFSFHLSFASFTYMFQLQIETKTSKCLVR